MSNIPATILVLQLISEVIAITCVSRPAHHAGPSRRLIIAVRKLSDFEVEPLVEPLGCLQENIQQHAKKAPNKKIAEKMDIQGGTKMAQFLLNALTLSNINRFSNKILSLSKSGENLK